MRNLIFLSLFFITAADFVSVPAIASWRCPQLFRTVLPWLKSQEELVAELSRAQKEVLYAENSYAQLLESIKKYDGISAAGKYAYEIRDALEKETKNLLQAQKKRFSLEKKYFTRPMKEDYVGEVIGVEWTNTLRQMGAGVYYLNAKEREYYRVSFDATKKLVDKKGEIIQGELIFVMDQEGRMYASYTPLEMPNGRSIRHSSFLAGAPVAAAGEILVMNGVIKTINRRSGHYKPTKKMNDQFLAMLKEQGIDTDAIEVHKEF